MNRRYASLIFASLLFLFAATAPAAVENLAWHYVEQGKGRPLVLLHGIGMSTNAWKPVMPLLAKERRVIAFDVVGFGQSPPIPAGVEPSMDSLVQSLEQNLRALGVTPPVDIAGNSMGGYIALEAAKRGLARSVVGVSPAGLWKEQPSAYLKAIFVVMRWMTKNLPGLSQWAMGIAPLRTMFLAVPVSLGAGVNMPAEDAIQTVKDFGECTGFEVAFSHAGRFSDGQNIKVPITVAFGTRDWILTSGSQLRDELPQQTRWLRPEGWGHVPMWYDPQGVAKVILDGTK